MTNIEEKGCYYDKNSDSYYIKYKGITRRGFTKKEAIKYRQGLKLGYITLDDIDNETKRNRKSNITTSIKSGTSKFYDIANSYLDTVKSRKSYETYRKEKRHFDKYIKPYFSDKSINSINILDCNELQLNIGSFKLVTNSKNDIVNTFKRIIHYGMRVNHIVEDPTVDMVAFNETLEEKENRLMRAKNIWTIEEFSKFISCIEELEYKLLFTLMYFTGMRIGETQALMWKHYDNGTIQIRQSLTETSEEGGWRIKTPKSRESIRDIVLDTHTKSLLDRYLEKEKAQGTYNENWFIFGRIHPLHRTTINRKKKSAIEKSGVKYISNHQMRHSHGSNLIESGVPIEYVKERLGHSDINITSKYYIHPTPKGNDILIKAIEKSSQCLLNRF